ncbi:Novobiocin biosynthesis protein H [Durusdinium trenchii]
MCEVPRRSTCSALLGTVATSAGATEPRQQVAAAMQKLEDLTNPDNFKKIAAGGGDNIRREVGTVGMTSPLFDVDKAFKALAEEAEDPEAYVEVLERFLKALTNADADAYSSIFSMNSAAATSPQVYINKAFEELEIAKTNAKELTRMLKM